MCDKELVVGLQLARQLYGRWRNSISRTRLKSTLIYSECVCLVCDKELVVGLQLARQLYGRWRNSMSRTRLKSTLIYSECVSCV